MNYLGIDYGSAKIGLAKGSDELTIATPLTIVSSLNEVIDSIEKEEIDEIVVGYPLQLSGEAGAQAQKVDRFIESIAQKTGKPVHKQDERFSTRSAVSQGDDDASAAALMLQTFLEKQAHSNQNDS